MIFDCYSTVDSVYGIVKDATVVAHSSSIYIVSVGMAKPSSEYPIVIIDPNTIGITNYGALTDHPEIIVPSLEAALTWCGTTYPDVPVAVIGDRATLIRAVTNPQLRHIYVSVMQLETVAGAEPFPAVAKPAVYQQVCARTQSIMYDFTNVEELAYLKLVERLMSAPPRPDRTGVGTRGLFHEVLKFTLHDNDMRKILPLITTKRTRFAPIYHELVWFLRGSTNTSYLVDNNVHIWDGNSTREYLDTYGLKHYACGEVGPIYGFQWRHAGAKYINEETRAATGTTAQSLTSGIDQIENVIGTLRRNPWDRRMIVCAWNVDQLAEMALPPCHYSFQFHVDGDSAGNPRYLNCLVNMRSADVFLGVPFNIASYSLLTHMIADLVGLTAGVLSLSMADCHIYQSHIEQAKLLLTRTPRQFPTIVMPRARRRINDYAYDNVIGDYVIEGYQPHAAISAPMAV